MSFNSCQSCLRSGIVARQVVLFFVFAIVLAAGIFEFAWSRPAFQAAWDKIEEVDSSSNSSDYTAEEFETLIGKQPFAIDESQPGVEVRTYRWLSGLPFRTHDIHVVYTKVSGVLAEKNPDIADDRFYYSASGGTPLTEDNFPSERPTIVLNRNPPSRAGSGGGGGRPQTPSVVAGSSEDEPAKGSDDGDQKQETEEKPADPGKADPPKENTEESPPKGGEPAGENTGETGDPAKPESGGKAGEGGSEGEGGTEGDGNAEGDDGSSEGDGDSDGEGGEGSGG